MWTTEEPATSIVEYRNVKTREVQQKKNEDKSTYHDILISDLIPATEYDIRVSGYNEKGNLVETEKGTRVATSKDMVSPEISALKIDSALLPGRADRAQTVVSWTTDEAANSTVWFEEGAGAPDAELENKKEDILSFVTDHKMILPNLKPGSVYRVRIGSVDPAGNATMFPVRTVVIPRQTESVLDVIFKNFEDTFKVLRGVP